MDYNIRVVYITDEGYAMPTCISITSLIANKSEEDYIIIYVICDNLTKVSREKIQCLSTEQVDIHIIDIDSEKYTSLSQKCLYASHIYVTAAALFKFDLPNLLSDEDKILYIDGDTVIQDSLYELYTKNLDKHYVAAVDDMMDCKENGLSSQAKRIGIKSNHYFNSGVMLLNLLKMRQDNVSEKLLYYREHGINYFMDQDTLNAILGRKRIILSEKYNFLTTVTDVYTGKEIVAKFMKGECAEDYINQATILHFAGTMKPWNYYLPWYSELFLKYYKMSPYLEQELKLKSPIKYLLDEKKRLVKQLTELKSSTEFVVPYKKIKKGSRIILYGAGNVGKSYKEQLSVTEYCEVVLWVDKKGKDAANGVVKPEEISGFCYDSIVIAIMDPYIASEVKKMLVSMLGISEELIITIF